MKNRTLLLLMAALFILITMASISASDVSDISNDQVISDSYSLSVESNVSELSSEDSNLESGDSSLSDVDDSKADSALDDLYKGKKCSLSNSSITSNSSSNGTKNAATIVVPSKNVVSGDYFNITLKDKNTNKALSGKTVIFTLNNRTYTKTTDSNGVARLSITGTPKVYLITVDFLGDSDYDKASQEVNITLTKTPTTIVNSGSYVNKGKAYVLTLKDAKGKLLSGAKITLVFNGRTYTRTTNSKGQASLTVSGPIGNTYKMTYKYAGNTNFLASSGSVNIKIRLGTSISGSGSSIVQGNTYKVTLKDANGAVLAKQKVTLTFGTRVYNKITNSKGQVSLKISATANKSYDLTYAFDGTSYYGPSQASVSLFVKTPTTMTNSGSSLVSGNAYKVTLKDSNGKALANKNVTFTISGKDYVKTTNSDGQASLTIKGTFGKTYPLSYKFAGDSEYGPSSGSVSLTIKKATSLTGSGTVLSQGDSYKVTLKDSSGTALANQAVVFTFGTRTYKKTTDSKGVASLKVTATAGKSYSMSVKYAGTSYYDGSSISQFNLSVKYPTSITNSGSSIMNGSSYKLTLKDSNNKTLANKTIVITFSGKTYQEITDSNGQVSIKIEASSPKSYALTYKFAGDDTYGESSGSVNLNVKFNNLFTIAQIKDAAASLKSYVLKNGKVPSTVSVNGISLNFTSFTYLASKALISINSNKSGDITLVNINSNYTNGGSSSIKGNLMKAKYVELAQKLNDYAESHKAIPNYINTTLGLVSPDLYSFGLAKALVFHDEEGYLPNYVILDSTDLNGHGSSDARGNSSQYKKGLNEKENLNDTEIASYAKASGHDALNDAIKKLAAQLVSGKSSLWAKATAIFNYVRDNISYSYYANSLKSASGTLSSKSGNCCDQANLIVALCRAANMTARFSHAQGCRFNSGLVTGHVWAQIYVDGIWYSADATSTRNSLGNIQNWNTNSFNTLKQYVHLPF